MRKWTVMLIPDKRGATRSLRLYSLQLWCVATLFIALSFTAGFFFRRQQVQARHLRML